MDWLLTDFGPQLGDNFRGLLILKALAAAQPRARMHLWVTPELMDQLGDLIKSFDFFERLVIRPRSVQQSYDLCFEAIKSLTGAGLGFELANFGPGEGPDGKTYDKLISTCEPWFSAKLLAGAPLQGPDVENQGQFLARVLGLSEAGIIAQAPLLGERPEPGGHICLGLCRPQPDDPKQLSPSLIDKVWQVVLASGVEAYALDYQNWRPPPQSPRVRDMRLLPLAQKISVLNTARFYVGADGGLNHFAAICGCPTLSFFGRPHGDQPAGPLVGPWPRYCARGPHRFFGRFSQYLSALEQALA